MSNRATLYCVLSGLLFVLISSLILTVRFPPNDNIERLQVGDVAPRDVLAPRRVTYTSEVETEAARARAEAAVAEIYDLPDASIARRQIARVPIPMLRSRKSASLSELSMTLF